MTAGSNWNTRSTREPPAKPRCGQCGSRTMARSSSRGTRRRRGSGSFTIEKKIKNRAGLDKIHARADLQEPHL